MIKQTKRPAFTAIYMSLARQLAQRSTCKRLQVGCVITSTDFRKVLSVGYNGTATGLKHQCREDLPGNCGDLHAEMNAIINCDAPRGTPKIIFVTHLPCEMCAKGIINLGDVERVYYGENYRSQLARYYFNNAGIAHKQITCEVK